MPPHTNESHNQTEATLQTLIDQAAHYLDQGNAGEAYSLLQQAQCIAPDNLDLLLALGDIAYQQHRTDQAKVYLNQAIQVDQQVYGAHFLLGLIALDEQTPDLALTHFQQCQQLDPEDVQTKLHIALSLQQLGQTQAAIDELIGLVHKSPQDQAVWQSLHNTLQAFPQKKQISIYERLTNKNPQLTEAHQAQIELYLQLQRVDQAITAAKQACTHNPLSQTLWLKLLTLYNANNRPQETITAFEDLISDELKTDSAIYLHYLEALITIEDLDKLEWIFNNKPISSTQDYTYAIAYARYLLLKKNTTQAKKVLQTLVSQHPKQPLAHIMLGQLFLKNQPQLALKQFTKAENAIEPDIQVLIGKAQCYIAIKNYPLATKYLSQAIAKDKVNSTAYELLSQVYLDTQEPEKAFAIIEMAKRYGTFSINIDLAAVKTAFTTNNFRAARDYAYHYLNTYPVNADVAHYLALSLHVLEDYETALIYHRQAIDLNDKNANYWESLAQTLVKSNKSADSSIHAFKQAIKLDPQSVIAKINLASVYYRQHQDDLAEALYREVLKADSRQAHALVGLAVISNSKKETKNTMSYYEQAVKAMPHLAEARWGLALTQLSMQDFEAGWKNYEARWDIPGLVKKIEFNFPRLTNLADIQNKSILVWMEQGLGDTIQFSRYIFELNKLGAKVSFGVQAPLKPLFHRQLPCQVVVQGDTVSVHDYHIPLLSLPQLFGTTLTNIPAHAPSLRAPQEKVKEWHQRLSPHQYTVGVAYSGNPSHNNDHNRSMPIQFLEKLFELKNCQFFIIQKGMKHDDLDFIKRFDNVDYLGNEIHNFADTAAIIDSLDTVISVDTAIIHLCGAMAKQAYLMLPYAAEWRWLNDTEQSPWYPSLNLIRQQQLNDWTHIINILKENFKNKSKVS